GSWNKQARLSVTLALRANRPHCLRAFSGRWPACSPFVDFSDPIPLSRSPNTASWLPHCRPADRGGHDVRIVDQLVVRGAYEHNYHFLILAWVNSLRTSADRPT